MAFHAMLEDSRPGVRIRAERHRTAMSGRRRFQVVRVHIEYGQISPSICGVLPVRSVAYATMPRQTPVRRAADEAFRTASATALAPPLLGSHSLIRGRALELEIKCQ
jgi:hypothetical protein